MALYSLSRFIVKSHRIWETFLVEQAGYQIDEVHEEAENLEHASSRKLVERLYALMDFPKADPHGSEIPSDRFWESHVIEINLSQGEMGHRYEVVAISDEIRAFLLDLSLGQPKFITIIKILPDASVIVKTDDEVRFVIPNFQKMDWELKYYSH